jgi:hypothetical protein
MLNLLCAVESLQSCTQTQESVSAFFCFSEAQVFDFANNNHLLSFIDIELFIELCYCQPDAVFSANEAYLSSNFFLLLLHTPIVKRITSFLLSSNIIINTNRRRNERTKDCNE